MTKARKPLPILQAPKPLTKEEQAQQVARMLAQKKEQYFNIILAGLLQAGTNPKQAVDLAAENADYALKKLYNLPDENEVAEK